jgi:hypothetical protein
MGWDGMGWDVRRPDYQSGHCMRKTGPIELIASPGWRMQSHFWIAASREDAINSNDRFAAVCSFEADQKGGNRHRMGWD